MALPYPSKVVLPFDIATAQDMNERHANDEALAAGTGLDDGAVTTAKLDDAAVTPAKRTGGYKVGVISGSTFSTTGNKSITGVGFTPKLVRFTLLALTATNIVRNSVGVMTPSESFTTATANSTSSIATRSWSGGNVAFAWLPSNSTSPTMSFSYVSMDADGFTINVNNADGSFAVAYEAYG